MRNRILLLIALSMLGSSSPCLIAKDVDTKNWATIAEMSARKLEKDPRNEKAWTDLVEARLKDEDVNYPERMKRAETALIAWRSRVATPAPVIERLTGEVAFAREKYPEAIAAWKHYLQAKPKDANGWSNLADAYEKMHDWQRGLDAISTAQEIQPDLGYLIQRAKFRIHLHDWENAKADLQEANRTDATDPKLQELYPIFERSAKWLPAIQKLDAAVVEQPQDYRLRLDRAEWLFGVGLEDAARDDIDAAFQSKPKSIRALIWKRFFARKLHEDEVATEVMPFQLKDITQEFEAELKAMDAEPDAETRAQFLLKYHQPVLALAQVEKVDGSPAKATALTMLKNRLTQAGQAARRATEVHPEAASAWRALGQVELENGNNREALTALECSLKLKSTPEADELRKTALRRLGKK